MQSNALALLYERPDAFDFCSAIRFYREIKTGHDEVRFNFYALDFPFNKSYEVEEIVVNDSSIDFVFNFESLAGGFGVFPRFYFDQMIKEVGLYETGEKPFHDFFQCFNQRYYELSFETQTIFHFCTQLESERINKKEKRSRFSELTENLAALSGSYDEAIIPTMHMVQYAGLFGQKISCPYTLGIILSDYFGYSVSIDSSELVCCDLPTDVKSRIGKVNSTLGDNMVVGGSSWMAFSQLLIVINIETPAEFLKLQSDRAILNKMKFMAQFYFGYSVFPKIQAKVSVSNFSGLTLSSSKNSSAQMRLGINSCLVTQLMVDEKEDAEHFVLVDIKV